MDSEPLRVLVVEDNPVDVVVLRDKLSSESEARFLLSTVDHLNHATSMLSHETFDAILLDLGLPDSKGLDTLLELRDQAPDTPIIVLSGLSDEALAIDALRHGAQDYFVKDKCDGFVLARAIKFSMERHILRNKLLQVQFELRKNEEALERTTRALRALTECNRALIRAANERDFMNDVCQIIVDVGGYPRAWIGFAVRDETKTVSPVAKAGFEEGDLEKTGVTWADSERGQGPTGTAVRTGQISVVKNVSTDPTVGPWCEKMLELGTVSVISLPLTVGGSVIGAITIAADEQAAFDEEEVKLLKELAEDLGHGIATLQVHAALHESKELYQTVVDNVGVGISLMDKDHNIVMVNNMIGRWFGKPASEFRGKKCFHAFGRGEAVCSYCPGEEAIRTGAAVEVERESLRHDGTRMHALIRAFPIFGSDGEATGFIEMMEDIGERKKAEDALRQSEERLELALKGADLGLWDWNLKTARPSWNDGAAEMLGYSLEEAEDSFRSWTSLVHPEDWPKVSEALEGHLEGRLPSFQIEGRHKCKSGDWKWILTRGKIVEYDADGKPSRMTGTTLDITDRKFAEQERESLRAQLVQAQKMESIGTLTGGIAHDFNNLLTVVLGFSELLLMGREESNPSYADLQKIHQAGRKGADLVQSLLAFSRKAEIKPRPINLRNQVEQLEKMLIRTIPKMIEIELNLADDLATVNADPTQIDQILMNLAINARDAMPDGGKLSIQTKNVALDEEFCKKHLGPKPGDYVVLSVSDTGHGMDEETLNHIFEPFYTTKEKGRGTGLGLAMVYGIVKQHGGYVACSSELGAGTTLAIYLPAFPMEAEPYFPEEEPALVGGTETILLVDDEEPIVGLGKRVLEQSGYTVVTAANGQEALDIYKQEKRRVSLVILDLIMPGMGGKQCLEELLKIDPQLRVLIASGYSGDGHKQETLAKGAKGFIGKPYDVRQMLKAIRDALDSDRASLGLKAAPGSGAS